MEWTQLKLKVSANDVDRAADICQMIADGGIYIEDYRTLEQETLEIAHIDLIDEALLGKDRATAYIYMYFPAADSPAECSAFLEERLYVAGIPFAIDTQTCRNEDWENNWKQYFRPLKVGKKLLILPLWEKELPSGYADRTVLKIEPGLAFGTGSHDTTRLCLEVMETQIAPGISVLDLGCGSGILSIAALLLGAARVTGVDIDELAVKTAIENGHVNGFFEPDYHIVQGDLTQQVHGVFHLVVANIVADAIIALSKDVRRFLTPDGTFLVSGIIDEREAEVTATLQQNGFQIINRMQRANWLCFVCKPR